MTFNFAPRYQTLGPALRSTAKHRPCANGQSRKLHRGAAKLFNATIQQNGNRPCNYIANSEQIHAGKLSLTTKLELLTVLVPSPITSKRRGQKPKRHPSAAMETRTRRQPCDAMATSIFSYKQRGYAFSAKQGLAQIPQCNSSASFPPPHPAPVRSAKLAHYANHHHHHQQQRLSLPTCR